MFGEFTLCLIECDFGLVQPLQDCYQLSVVFILCAAMNQDVINHADMRFWKYSGAKVIPKGSLLK